MNLLYVCRHMFIYSLQNPNVVYTAEQRGQMHRVDLRTKVVEMNFEIFGENDEIRPIKYMIQHPYLGEHYVIYTESDYMVTMIDLRNTTVRAIRYGTKVIRLWDPHFLPPYDDITFSSPYECRPHEGDSSEMRISSSHNQHVSASGMSFSNDGRQFLVNYQHDQIYAFRTREMKTYSEGNNLPIEGSVAVYGGHKNTDTFLKNVSYFGPNNEYVLAGSDSGDMWIWDANTGHRGFMRPEYPLHRTAEVVSCLKAGKRDPKLAVKLTFD
jgi:hypothetical protein